MPTSSFNASNSSPKQTQLISTLHTILRPFLLRRLKVDVETDLPPKKEYVLYAPLTVRQRELYDAILDGHLRAILMKGQNSLDVKLRHENGKENQNGREGMKRRSQTKRKGARKKYGDIDGDDDEYFRKLESGELEEDEGRERDKDKGKSAEELGSEWQLRAQSECLLLLLVKRYCLTDSPVRNSEEDQQPQTPEYRDATP